MKSQHLLILALIIGLPTAYFLGTKKEEVPQAERILPSPVESIPISEPTPEFSEPPEASYGVLLEEPRSDFLGGFRDGFLLVESSRAMTAQEDVFIGERTQSRIPDSVRDLSGFYDLSVTFSSQYGNEKLTGNLRIFFRSRDLKNPELYYAVADSSLFDADENIWRRMTGKKSRNLKLTNPFEFGLDAKSGSFTGAESGAILSQKLERLLWAEPVLPGLKRLNFRGVAERDAEQANFTGSITGEVTVKKPDAESDLSDAVVGTFVMKRVGL